MAAGAMESSVKALERTISSNTQAHLDSVLRTYHQAAEGRSYEDRSICRDEWKSRNLADCIAQIACVVTPQGRGQYFNPYWESYTGLSEGQSLDLGWTRAFHREDIDGFIEFLRRPLEANGCEFEARLRRASDGSYRRQLCRCSIVTSQSDGLINLLISCTDIENWRNAEAAAKEQGALLGLSLRTHDEEKRKIAHGLHDSAGQYMVALQMKLDNLQRCSTTGNAGRNNPLVDECRELVKRCCREIRSISYLLYPPLLDDLGLESAVHLYADGFRERTKATVELEIEPNLGRLDRDLEIALFRVVQEASANIHRQCASKNVHIKIGAGPTSVFVEIAGSGGPETSASKFAASSQTPSVICMATLLRQRILEVGGLFEIGSLADRVVMRAAVPRRALVAQACD
jgi:PAS domain S-box-containing protein